MTTLTTAPRTGSNPLEIELRGRTYPRRWSGPGVEVHIEDVAGQLSATQSQLLQELRSRIPFLTQRITGSTAELAEAYVSSLQILAQFREDLQRLIPSLCEASLELRSGSESNEGPRREAFARKLDEMIETAQMQIRPIKNAINAEVLALGPSDARDVLQRSLEKNVRRFVLDFFESLDQLVDREVAGLVQWTGQNACRYHFFREVVIQTHDGTRSRTQDLERTVLHGVWRERTEVTEYGTEIHRHARHEHHVVEAIQITIEDADVDIPPAVIQVLESIPDWLRPIVRIISGKIAAERIIERDVKTDTWEDRQVHERIVYGPDPAVVIDHIVLVGWGPRDIEAEQARRRTLTEVNERKRSPYMAALAACCGLVLAVTSIGLLWGALTLPKLVLGMVPLLAAIPCWNLSLSYAAQAREVAITQKSLLGGSLGMTLLFGGVGLWSAFGFASGFLTSAAVLMSISGSILAAFAISRPRPFIER